MSVAMYEPIKEQSFEESREYNEQQPKWRTDISFFRSWLFFTLIGILSASVFLNAILLLRLNNEQCTGTTGLHNYADMYRDTTFEISPDHRSLTHPVWDDPALDPNAGMVALSDDFMAAKGLPRSQRYPWDHSKGIYFLNGYHNLHCVLLLRTSVMEAHSSKPQTWGLGHLGHCLNILREDIVCNADDLPRYTGRVNQQEGLETPPSGTGQIKMCRDWSQLHAFALAHSACYHRDPAQDVPLIDRYKNCPDGSRPWEEAKTERV